MALLWKKQKQKNVSKRHRRFLTSIDMASAKQEEARFNALAKRGEVPGKHTSMTVCSCGMEGCIFCSVEQKLED